MPIKLNKKQALTMGIKHRADSAFRKFSALSELGFGRTEKCFESPTFLSRDRMPN